MRVSANIYNVSLFGIGFGFHLVCNSLVGPQKLVSKSHLSHTRKLKLTSLTFAKHLGLGQVEAILLKGRIGQWQSQGHTCECYSQRALATAWKLHLWGWGNLLYVNQVVYKFSLSAQELKLVTSPPATLTSSRDKGFTVDVYLALVMLRPSRWDAASPQIKMVSFHLTARHSAANRASNDAKREEEDKSLRQHFWLKMVSGFEFPDHSKEETGNFFLKIQISTFLVPGAILSSRSMLCSRLNNFHAIEVERIKRLIFRRGVNRRIVVSLLREDFLGWIGSYHNLYRIPVYLNRKKMRTQ